MARTALRAEHIDVLLSTHNGDEFLTAQLDSLLNQDYPSCRILARDDGSTDDSLGILRQYADRFPGRIVLFCDEKNCLGVVGSYNWLMSRSTAPYVAFSDQDDVWYPGKLRILMARMLAAQTRLGANRPILIHCDLEVVDQQLESKQHSYWAYAGLNWRYAGLAPLLVSNSVTACAMLANRALIRRAMPIPAEALMHDHWLALVAAAFGHIKPVHQSLVAYRQHSRNTLGAHGSGWRALLRRIRADGGRKDISALQVQAHRFAERFADSLDSGQRELVNGFSTLHRRNWIARRLFLIRHRVLRVGIARNLVLLFYVRMAGESH